MVRGGKVGDEPDPASHGRRNRDDDAARGGGAVVGRARPQGTGVSRPRTKPRRKRNESCESYQPISRRSARTHRRHIRLSEEAFAGIVVLTRLMFGPSSGPPAAELSYPPPPWAAEYTRLWRCPVTFDCERTTLTMPIALEERRVPTANATQFEAALHATRAILDSDPVDALVPAVAGTLRQDLRSRRTATQVADALGTSPRTLHRHLAKAGYSFGAIQDRVRRQQADVLLTQTRRSIAAIAAELGYSDPREFRRAYTVLRARSATILPSTRPGAAPTPRTSDV
ncbi:helix-turn-helix domain-containing protein [Streptomyces sp. NPDC018693]|uniref:helix-turn-helix transcriptional regulator n=1 Tax=unclassified Streptomyces TaxID=2593676 RepID=UPI0037B3F22B